MFIWIGSIVSILITILVSLVSIGLSKAWTIMLIGIFYLLVVQGITITIYIPLNNHIQNIKIEKLNEKSIAYERINFGKKIEFFQLYSNSCSYFYELFITDNIKFTLNRSF